MASEMQNAKARVGKPLRLVFCGTPEFAVAALEAVCDAGYDVPLVLTQPDRPAGRKLEVQTSAVKQAALARGLEVLQPEKIRNNDELRARLEAIAPDVIVVVAYGRIVPQWMLELPRLGCVNVHGSLLPKYRGAAPIQWAVANGERETGVTTMKLDAGLDTGDMLLRQAVAVSEDATAAELYPVLAEVGAALLLRTLEGLADGTLAGEKQDDADATLAPILTREDGRLDLARTAEQTYDRWRGFSPWPGCWAMFGGKRFLLQRMKHIDLDLLEELEPGRLLLHHDALTLICAQGTALRLEEVQLEGKPRMSGVEFWKGFQLKPGARLE
jgi:methionyl-tRNA formyltransferase